MLVYEYFPGDDVPFAWHQHDRYGQALLIIEEQSKGHVRHACAILDLAPVDFTFSGERDHRTLQVAHDLLAAAWRFLFRHAQRDLFKPLLPDDDDWLEWLRQEVREPVLAGTLRRMLQFQNSAKRYAAEDQPRRSLLDRFADVPWYAGTAARRQW